MNLALNTNTLSPRASLLEKIRATAQAGFPGIEPHVHEVYDHLIVAGGSLSGIRQALDDHGLAVPSMLGFRNWGDLQGVDYQIHLTEARRRLRIAAALGCPFLVCSTPMYHADWSHLHERYRDLLEIGRQEGATPAFEFIGHYASVTNLADARTMLDRTGDPDACLCMDAFHNWNGGSSPDDVRNFPVEKVAHYHIDDAQPGIPKGKLDDTMRVLPGDGQIDLHTELRILKEKGYQNWISLELFNPDLWAMPLNDAAQLGYDRVTTLLTDCGFPP